MSLSSYPSGGETTPEDEALPELISRNIEAIADYKMSIDKDVSRYQRAIETVTAFLGRPLFFYLILAFVLLWISLNLGEIHFHQKPWDPPPFYWLQGLVGLAALLMTTVVLITQNRQGRLSERHAHLDLQINLLAEQKITKLIALIEELRRDLPNVKDRHDPEAEAMTEAADAQAVLSALEETLDQAQEEVEELEEAIHGLPDSD